MSEAALPPLCALLLDGEYWRVGVGDDPAVLDRVLDGAGNPKVDTLVHAGPDGQDRVFRHLCTVEEVAAGHGWIVVCNGAAVGSLETVFAEARAEGAVGSRLSLWTPDGESWDVVRQRPPASKRSRVRRRR